VQNRLLLALLVLSATSFGQNTGPTGPDTEYAPCLEGQAGSRFYQSPPLATPDGQWHAYASVEAFGSDFACATTSTLLVQGPEERDYFPVYVEKPTSDSPGNGMKPISWSRQRHLLAVQVLYWQYGSDAGSPPLLIYDADRKLTIKPDLATLFARKYNKKECAFDIRDVLGFDSQNHLLFTADDVIDPGDEEPLPETRCLGDHTEWALDIDKDQLELVKRLPRPIQ
jgi:hypothetical protein